jgi:hypothetical protein
LVLFLFFFYLGPTTDRDRPTCTRRRRSSQKSERTLFFLTTLQLYLILFVSRSKP